MANRAARLVAACLALPLTGLQPGAAGADTAAESVGSTVGSVQAESLRLGDRVGSVQTDAGAQGGRSLRLVRTGRATGSVSTAGAATAVTVRARGDQCEGAPRLRISLDGRELATSAVATSSWTTLRVPVRAAAGRHELTVAFPNDVRTDRCDRNLHVDAVTFVGGDGPTAEPPTGGSLVFDSAVADKGLSAYASTHNAHRVSVVRDPVLGDARKVLRFTVADGDDQLTGNPRAQLQTSTFWRPGAEHYVGMSFYFPRDWPEQRDTRQWVNLGEVYGAPYAGASPNGLFVKKVSSGKQVIAWQRNGTYGWDRPFEVPLVRGRWHDFVFRIKLSRDPAEGFWEAWSNTGDGWQRLMLHGKQRLHSRTIDASNGGGANYHKLSHYRSKGMWPVATHYAAGHRVGSSFAAVAPRSYR